MHFLKILLSSFFISSCYSAFAQDNGYKEVQLTTGTADNRYATYNKKGNTILFESNRDGHWQIYTMDVDGNHQKRLINSAFNDRRPTWNPYKNLVLFESDRSGLSELYIFDLDFKTIQKVPIALDGNKTFGQFAPNGVDLAFNYENTNDDIDIYLINYKGKRLKKIIDDEFKNLRPQYSPRGNAIAYFSNKNNIKDTDVIYVYNIYLKEKSKLTYFKDQSYYPTWSNNGSKIAYSSSYDNEKTEIYMMSYDGKHKRRITFNDTEDILPYWSPKDINLLITRKVNNNYQICKILLKEPL